MTQLDSLKEWTKVVADTGEIQEIKKYSPAEVTTNPSLIFKAAQQPHYQNIIKEAIGYGKKNTTNPDEIVDFAIDALLVGVGSEILQTISGRVSTEIEVSLSFSVEKSLMRARRIIALFEQKNIAREQVLIKLAGTWQGIQCVEILEQEGISCNVTLIFSIAQAIAAANANATLISPFVGRISDWYKEKEPNKTFSVETDPGVLSVKTIYEYLKNKHSRTEVMGASFRSKEQVLALAGIDALTISPKILEELQSCDGTVQPQLNVQAAQNLKLPTQEMTEETFYWKMCTDPMASTKLPEGIRLFDKDTQSLKMFLKNLL